MPADAVDYAGGARQARLARLREALQALTPAQQQQVVTIAAKLLVTKARKRRALKIATAAAMAPVGTQFELFDSYKPRPPSEKAPELQLSLSGV